MEKNRKIIQKRPPWTRGLLYYARCRVLKNPLLVNLEFTKRCNAKCSFCQYWKLAQHNELKDYSPIIKLFKPVTVSMSGGEPLLRKDCPELIKKIRPYGHYLSLITNGALLNEDIAYKLVGAGLDHISISLDYLDNTHDKVRQIPGLYKHISYIVPKLASLGYRLSLNTIIMESNLDTIIPIAHEAKKWGVSVSYSAYCSLKIGNDAGMVREKQLTKLDQVIAELTNLKRKLGNIRNSDYYLQRVPEYFRNGVIPNCHAGIKWIHVSPDGYLQQCSELPRICHYSEYRKDLISHTACEKCWYTCRGESEAKHLTPRRFIELFKA